MSDAYTQFEKRLNNLERKHRELSNGYVAKINPDGLITVAPKEKRKGLILRLMLAVLVGVIAFKSITLAIIGPSTYEARLATLSDGNWFEGVCAWVMQIDPATQAIGNFLSATF